jgi:hypothetical protein
MSTNEYLVTTKRVSQVIGYNKEMLHFNITIIARKRQLSAQ